MVCFKKYKTKGRVTMDKKQKNTLWQITIAVLACIVLATALFIISNITESDNNIAANTQVTEVTTKDMLDDGMSYIDEDSYKLLCENMDYNHIMFTGENLANKYVAMDITLTEKRYFSSDDKKDESTQKIINAYNLQTESYKAIVKNLKTNEYKGESISVYFSKDYALNANDYKIGDKLRIYGLVTYCQNNGTGNYNSVSFIPRFIEK